MCAEGVRGCLESAPVEAGVGGCWWRIRVTEGEGKRQRPSRWDLERPPLRAVCGLADGPGLGAACHRQGKASPRSRPSLCPCRTPVAQKLSEVPSRAETPAADRLPEEGPCPGAAFGEGGGGGRVGNVPRSAHGGW